MIMRLRIRVCVIGAFSVLLCIVPIVSSAYFTTSQQAISITDRTAFFTVTYAFGREDDEMRLPIAALRDLPHGSGTSTLGYRILRDGDEIADEGTAAGIVLSNTPIDNGMYVTPAGEARTFTLFVIYTISPDNPASEYALNVTHLPFSFDETPQSLNPSELQYYTTPETELNDRP